MPRNPTDPHYHCFFVLYEDEYQALKRVANSEGWSCTVDFEGIKDPEAEDALKAVLIGILGRLKNENLRRVN